MKFHLKAAKSLFSGLLISCSLSISSVFAATADTLAQQAQQFQQGLVAYQSKDWSQAQAIWSKLLEQDDLPPELLRALNNNIGSALLQQGKVDEAANFLQQALRSDAQIAKTLDNLNKIYAYQAQKAYKKVFDKVDVAKPTAEILYFNTTDAVPMTPNVVLAMPESVTPVLNPQSENTEFKEVAKIELSEAEQNVLTELTVAWGRAWASQDVEGYLSFYHDTEFKPSKGQSLKTWRKGRYASVGNPKFINIELVDIEASGESETQVVTAFLQKYHSDRFKDNIHKELVWQKVGKGWKIVRERVIYGKR